MYVLEMKEQSNESNTLSQRLKMLLKSSVRLDIASMQLKVIVGNILHCTKRHKIKLEYAN